jgi:hypothetical protein
LLLVEGAGFPPSDAQALVDESGADEARVRDALDSLQAVRARKAVPSPRGYLATFLRNGWALDAAVAERRDADRRRAGQADRQRAREHAAAKRRADEQAEALEAGREVRRRLDAASDDDLERARAEVLREMPGRFGRLFDRLNLRGELHGPEAAFAFSVAQRLARNETAPSPAKAAGSRGGKVGATGATA